MRISQLAQAADVHVETIRYYQRRGLIKQPSKPAHGYRNYPAETLNRIRFIRRAQELGFTLNEISHLLELEAIPCHDVMLLAETKLQSVQEKIRDLQRLASVLNHLVGQCQDNPDDTHCPIVASLQP